MIIIEVYLSAIVIILTNLFGYYKLKKQFHLSKEFLPIFFREKIPSNIGRSRTC